MAVRQLHTASIANNAITTDHIGTGVIVTDDLAANAVTTTDIQDLSYWRGLRGNLSLF